MMQLRSFAFKFRKPGRLRFPLAPDWLAFTLVSICLLGLSRINHSALVSARAALAAWMSPVLQAAMVPLEPVRRAGWQLAEQAGLGQEVERLRLENQKLANWEWRARELERKLADLQALSKTVPETRIEFVTSRVISDSSGAFVRSVMIDAGRNANIQNGYPVINGDGLAGRILETGAQSSRVMLLTDLSSRVPVSVGPNGARGILAGDHGTHPRLVYTPQYAGIRAGDDVSTSGSGGIFPRGLRIGEVISERGELRVKLRANLDALEFVSVLFFDDPARALLGEARDREAPASKAPQPMTGTAAELGAPK